MSAQVVATTRSPGGHVRPSAVFGWAAVAAVAGASAAVGAAPVLLVLGPLLLGISLALLGSLMPLLWIILATAGLGLGWADDSTLVVAGNPVNASGLRWGLVVLAGAAILFRDGLPEIPVHLRGYIAFVAFSALGILWAPSLFEGLKHVLQFAAPLMVGLVALHAIRSRSDEDLLRRAFWIGLALAAVAELTLGLTGLSRFATEEGRLVHPAIGPYLLPLMGLALAGWRYRGPAFALVVALIFALGLLTLSRATVLVMLVMVVLSMWGRPLRWYIGVGLAVALLAAAALQYEPFRDRVFDEDSAGTVGGAGPPVTIQGEGEEAQLVVAGVSLSGRGVIWMRTLMHAAEAPVLGHGTGSSTHFLSTEVGLGVHHPHNDYLRVLHDGGVVGLLVLLAALWMIARHLVRQHRSARDLRARETVLAAGLAFAGFVVLIIFDNALVYAVAVTQNLFLLLVLAHFATRHREAGAGGA